jgi:hypothetical protein
LVLLFDAEDGSIRFLHNFDELLPVYTASHRLHFISSVMRTSDTADKMIYGERCHFAYVLMDVGGVEVKFQSFYEKKMTIADTGATETKKNAGKRKWVHLENIIGTNKDWPCRNPVRLLRTQQRALLQNRPGRLMLCRQNGPLAQSRGGG